MMKAQPYLFILPVIIINPSHGGHNNPSLASWEQIDRLVFGRYTAGMTEDDSVEIFALTNQALYENLLNNDSLPAGNADKQFVPLGQEKFELVKELMQQVPSELLKEKEVFIGSPDSTDGGGIYIEVHDTEEKRFWLIDNNTAHIPQYLRSFVATVNAKINMLR
ncbi:MAG TPA: hypothetical protein VD816_09900 [Ohtaekwangia sp.]|nr:hypothetical protein [Ohtaekwangia sp.]